MKKTPIVSLLIFALGFALSPQAHALDEVISGYVWTDTDGDSIGPFSTPAEESGISGVQVTATYDANCDGVAGGTPPSGIPTSVSATTNGSGFFSLAVTGLANNSNLCFVLDVNESTLPGGGSGYGLTTSNEPWLIVVTGNSSYPVAHFGYRNNNLHIIGHTAPNIVVDHNGYASNIGPEVFHIGAQVCNASSSQTLTNVRAYVGNGTIPGEFPDSPSNGDPGEYTGFYELVLLDDWMRGARMGQYTGTTSSTVGDDSLNGSNIIDASDATRLLGNIAPGACVGVYWPVAYPLYDPKNSGLPVFGSLNVPSDDLNLPFVIWAVADGGVMTVLSDFSTVRDEQQANPNKIQPTGNPSGFVTVSPSAQVSVGQTVCITYHNVDFGNVNQGFDANLDGRADYDLWFQPVGEKTYDPDVLRLIESSGTLKAQNCGPSATPPTVSLLDDTYDTNIDRLDLNHNSSCNMVGQYSYCFVKLASGSSTLNPYQETASGSNQEKYNGDYNEAAICISPTPADDTNAGLPGIQVSASGGCITIGDGGTPPTIDKTVDRDIVNSAPGAEGELTYSLSFTNSPPSTQPVGDPDSGNHVVFTDSIPKLPGSGGTPVTSYVAGSATCTGLTNGCSVQYSTDNRSSWVSLEPAAASVTDLRFVFNDPVPVSSTVTAGFRLAIGSGWTGTIQNFAQVRLDNGPVVDEDDAVTCVNVGPCDTTTTSVFLSRFGSFVDGGAVVLQWETAAEVGTLGFNVERLDPASGQYQRINPDMLLGLLHAPAGGQYRFVDNGAWPTETYSYRLVELEASGKEKIYGPFTVRAADGSSHVMESGESFGSLNSGYMRTARGLSSAQQTRVAAHKAEQVKVKGQGRKSGASARIGVTQSGIHFIPVADIAAALNGGDKLLKGNGLRLAYRGQDAALWPAADGSGVYFYGAAIDSIFTDENAYYISAAPGTRMSELRGKAPRPLSSQAAFRDQVHGEQDVTAITLGSDPESDFYYWQFVMGEFRYPAAVGVATPHPAAAGSATLRVSVQALNDLPQHRIQVKLNGSPVSLDVDQWSGQSAFSAVGSFDQSLLRASGDNEIAVSTLSPGSMIFVDSFDIDYRRLFRAVDNRIRVRGDGNSVVTVDGFTTADIEVFDVSDPLRVKRIAATTIDPAAGGYRVAFAAESPLSTYYVTTRAAALAPASLAVDSPSQLRANRDGASYVIVTPASLVPSAEVLAEHRRSQGLSVLVASLEDVQDEFSGGVATPHALRDFMIYASTHWNTRPRYLLIGGNGTYDYKNVEKFGDNVVPPLLTATPHGLFAADNRFGDLNGDGRPEIAVGRLPVLTATEFDAVIAKIRAYEADRSAPPENVILAADDTDGGGNFRSDSEALAAMLPGSYNVKRSYLSDLPIVSARSKLQADLNAGAGIFNYIGHGASTLIGEKSGQALMSIADIDALSSGSKRPIMLALTCQAGRYDPPGHVSLGEVLVLDADGGTVATWAPTGQSFNDEARILNRGFFEAVYQRGERRLGDAVLYALERHAAEGKQPYTQGIYNLLADPGLTINLQR